MLLSDRDLTAAITSGDLVVDPYEPALLQPSSIDVRLHRKFEVWDQGHGVIDPQQQPAMRPITVPAGKPFQLEPGQMALGSTYERITLSAAYAARVEGKSSIGRLGTAVHVTAGFIDPGFTGRITLELVNQAPHTVKLWPGMQIGQLCVFRLSSPAERPYGSEGLGSHYQDQDGPTPSRSARGFRIWPIEDDQ